MPIQTAPPPPRSARVLAALMAARFPVGLESGRRHRKACGPATWPPRAGCALVPIQSKSTSGRAACHCRRPLLRNRSACASAAGRGQQVVVSSGGGLSAASAEFKFEMVGRGWDTRAPQTLGFKQQVQQQQQ